MKVSIDNLTILGNQAEDSLDYFLNENVLITNAITNHGFSKYPYKEFYSFIDGSMLQIKGSDGKSSNVKDLRYEFNPNHTTNGESGKSYEKLYMQVLKQMTEPHISRLDIAIDLYGIDMSSWDWIDTKGRPSNIYFSGNKEIETYYIGGKRSEMKIRIYNKALEQGIEHSTWWRVEVQMRGSYIKEWMMGEKNPFEGIHPCPTDLKYRNLDVEQKAVIDFLFETLSNGNTLAGIKKESIELYSKI